MNSAIEWCEFVPNLIMPSTNYEFLLLIIPYNFILSMSLDGSSTTKLLFIFRERRETITRRQDAAKDQPHNGVPKPTAAAASCRWPPSPTSAWQPFAAWPAPIKQHDSQLRSIQ